MTPLRKIYEKIIIIVIIVTKTTTTTTIIIIIMITIIIMENKHIKNSIIWMVDHSHFESCYYFFLAFFF